MYLRNTQVVLVMFDVTQRTTFQYALNYIQEFKPILVSSVVALVGTQADLPAETHEVTHDEATSYAQVRLFPCVAHAVARDFETMLLCAVACRGVSCVRRQHL